MTRRQTIAAVIPVKNCEKLMHGVLDSLWFCDEVIVVDMFSTDATKKICESYRNVRFFERQDYIYGNFNFGMDQATSDWIIRLDSDERLSVELQDEIIALLSGDPKHDVYTAPFVSYFVGHPMIHGSAFEKPRRKTMFKRGKLRYRVESEHEDLTPTSDASISVGELKGQYIHFSVPSISKYLKKIDYYSAQDFARADASKIRVLPPWRAALATIRYFVRKYISQKGYRDGYHGFAICALDSFYMLVNQLKGWEFKEGLRAKHDATRDGFDRSMKENRIRRSGE